MKIVSGEFSLMGSYAAKRWFCKCCFGHSCLTNCTCLASGNACKINLFGIKFLVWIQTDCFEMCHFFYVFPTLAVKWNFTLEPRSSGSTRGSNVLISHPATFLKIGLKPDIFWDCKSYPNFLGRTETISSALTISCRQKRELDFLFQFSVYWRLSCSKGDWGFNTKGEFLRNSTRTSESSSTAK